ncbi:hypothetical protein AB0H83_21525 [Dactylosporangium sp. NPDC050688]|uniref:hypothetical protein n=1 Tax=Dactylosporangium sp. NPDC050688 TaxID=3157217 RepID=UPI0033C4237B
MSAARYRDRLTLLGALTAVAFLGAAVLPWLAAAGPVERQAAATGYLTPQYTPYLGSGNAVPDGPGWAGPLGLDGGAGIALWAGLALAVAAAAWSRSARRGSPGLLY